MSFSRRNFLTSVAGAAASAAVLKSQSANSRADAHIEVLLDEPIGEIAPDIYGHFIEHLGGVIYDGIWVGPGSKVPNEGGIRKTTIDAFKSVKVPVIRWPGGCFADSYDWRDGLGSASDRKTRTNFWGGTDPNTFGTQEFIRLCELTGAKPYFAANLRSLPARDFYQWVEYANSPAGSSEGAKRRGEHGHPEPFKVHFWGVGNESWGCGGNFTPEDYAAEFRRFTAWVPEYGDHLALIASGPSDHEVSWTRRLMQSMMEKGGVRNIYGLSLHYYTWNLSGGKTRDWDKGKGDALQFGEFEWYELFSQGYDMDSIIREHWAVMSESDPQHHVKLIVDEWGAWYRPGSGLGEKYTLSQIPTLRDALLTGLTLDIFHRHADKVAMANVAQSINCLHSLMLASEDKFVLTPTYHVFKMYEPHMGAKAVRTEMAAPPLSYDRNGKPASLWGLNGSASVSGKQLTLTVVNPHVSRPVEAEIVIRTAPVSGGSATVLTASDIHAHNDFQHPDLVKPASAKVTVRSGRIVHEFPPASVSALSLILS
jgi:alpha-N-arabinofuranosidase